jgi:hypothetical protein
MIQQHSFDNFGIIVDEIPLNLFSKLKTEALSIEKNIGSNKPMISGLTSTGVANHFYMNQTHEQEFINYVTKLTFIYLETYQSYMGIHKSLSHDVTFAASRAWFNVQKNGEYIPNHTHDGFLSYTSWIKIPDNIEDIYEGKLEFTYSTIIGTNLNKIIKIDKSFEGKIMMFPSLLQHCVYPFTTVEDTRISLSGNILFYTKI